MAQRTRARCKTLTRTGQKTVFESEASGTEKFNLAVEPLMELKPRRQRRHVDAGHNGITTAGLHNRAGTEESVLRQLVRAHQGPCSTPQQREIEARVFNKVDAPISTAPSPSRPPARSSDKSTPHLLDVNLFRDPVADLGRRRPG